MENERKMEIFKCGKCGRVVCESDGEKICFRMLGNYVCQWIRGNKETFNCQCGKRIEIFRKSQKMIAKSSK